MSDSIKQTQSHLLRVVWYIVHVCVHCLCIIQIVNYSHTHTHTHTHTHRAGVSSPPSFSCTSSTADTSNDQMLAMMLQLEFDKEHDTILRAEEKAYNRDSKGTCMFLL